MSYFEKGTTYPYFYSTTNADANVDTGDIFLFQSEIFDNGSNVLYGNTFVAPVKGLYFINVTISIKNQSASAADAMTWGIRHINSSNVLIENVYVKDDWEIKTTSTLAYNKSLSSTFFMNPSEKIIVLKNTDAATAQTLIKGNCHLCGCLITPFS